MALRGGRELPTADTEAEKVWVGARAGGGVEAAAGARRKIYTCPGGSRSAEGAPALWLCGLPSARGYLNHELPFVLWERETGVVDDNRAMNVPQSAHDKTEEDCDWGCCCNSWTRLEKGQGSTVNIPVWIAVRTERRDNQFREGARSRRTVGSLDEYC